MAIHKHTDKTGKGRRLNGAAGVLIEPLPLAETSPTGQRPDRERLQPAFYDTLNGEIYVSRFADGNPAPVHLPHGLPEGLRDDRRSPGHRLKDHVLVGYLCGQRFYPRSHHGRTAHGRDNAQEARGESTTGKRAD